jgi:hypothetical protein
MKLFTAEIESKLQKQFPLGSNLESQQVICKIFNPYGRFTWYIVNQDPEDPDYLWAIVDGFEVEIGSVSKSELESIKVPPFGLPLERDRGFNPKNAAEVFRGLLEGKHYRSGGKTPNMATIESLPGKTMFLYHLGMDEPSLLTIKSARMSDPKYTVRSLFVESTEGGETRLDDGKVDEFLSGKTVALRDSQGEPYAVKLDTSMVKKAEGGYGHSDGDRVATYPKDKFTEQEAIDAFAFAMESKKEQSGTFDPIKRIEEEGKLVRYVDTRGNGKKYFDTIIPNKKEPGYYKRYESTQKGVLGVLQNEFLDADDVRMWVEKTRPKSRMGEGGPATFDDKVKAISSSLEGTKVKPKYQKQYGKRYDKAEATEAATKIAGAMTAKERRKSILSKYKK